MPRDAPKLQFITVTPQESGGLYKDRASALSAINSHAARYKGAGSTRHGNHSSEKDRQRRANKHQKASSSRSLDSCVAVNNNDATSETQASISLLHLKEIFDESSKAGEAVSVKQDGTSAFSSPSLAICSPKAKTHASQATRSIGGGISAWVDGQRAHVVSSISTPLPGQIDGGVIPFVSLPVKVSHKEQQLLQFYLSKGRRLVFETSTAPAFCPALFCVGAGALERSSVFVETHIVMAEHLLTELCGIQLSDNFYRRRASAYRTVAELVSNQNIGLSELLLSLMCLQLTEHVLGRTDLQVQHLKAMDELIERNGGMQCFLRERAPTELCFYAGQFICTQFPTPRGRLSTTKLVVMLVSWLRMIRLWALSTWGDSTALERPKSADALTSIRDYLLNGVERHLGDAAASYYDSAGPFYLLFNACAIMSARNMDSFAATRFLALWYNHLKKSVGEQPEQTTSNGQLVDGDLDRLQPRVAAFLIPYIARIVEGDPGRNSMKIEVAVSEATVNAMKAFSLLSASMRLRIGRGLFQCCMREPGSAECFGEEELSDLALELHLA